MLGQYEEVPIHEDSLDIVYWLICTRCDEEAESGGGNQYIFLDRLKEDG